MITHFVYFGMGGSHKGMDGCLLPHKSQALVGVSIETSIGPATKGAC